MQHVIFCGFMMYFIFMERSYGANPETLIMIQGAFSFLAFIVTHTRKPNITSYPATIKYIKFIWSTYSYVRTPDIKLRLTGLTLAVSKFDYHQSSLDHEKVHRPYYIHIASYYFFDKIKISLYPFKIKQYINIFFNVYEIL